MDLHSLAAEVLVCLATNPGRQESVEALTDRLSVADADMAAACGMLSDWRLLDIPQPGVLALIPGRVAAAGRLVLVIENTPAVAHVLNALLESEGYRVLHASQLEDGLTLLEVVLPALVIADSFSPSAAEVLNRLQPLRACAAPAPVMIFTAYRGIDESDVQGAGYAGLIPKPFDIDALLERVREGSGACRRA
jgi:CheY-like chemotaxis protein